MRTHRSPHRRRAVFAAGTLLALTSLTACGGDGDEDATENTGAAASSSVDTPSATPGATSSATATPAEESSEPAPRNAGEEIDPEEFLEVYQAAVEQATSAKIAMDQSASGLTGQGAIDYASGPLAMQMTVTLASMGDIEMRLVDNVMYMKLPMLGDKFIAFDLDDPNNPLGSSFGDLFDIDKMLAAFAAGVESATYAGEEDVEGEPMDHYTVVTDPSALLEDLELPEGVPQVDLPATQLIDVWFDAEGYFRRVAADLGPLGSMNVTYDDWGTDVDVEAPPTDQITTMPGASAA